MIIVRESIYGRCSKSRTCLLLPYHGKNQAKSSWSPAISSLLLLLSLNSSNHRYCMISTRIHPCHPLTVGRCKSEVYTISVILL